MTIWAIYLQSTGALVAQVTCDTHPRFNGFEWESGVHAATALAGAGDPVVQSWNPVAKAWADDPAKVQAILLTQVKLDAEQKKMSLLSAGGAKKTEYADKMREVVAWDSLGATLAAILSALALLPADVRALRFAYTYADAAAFGDQPQNAIARFKAGIASSNKVAMIAAAEAKACAAIKSAATVAAKRAVPPAIVWPS